MSDQHPHMSALEHTDVRLFLVVRVVAISSLLLAALLIQWTTSVVLPIDYIYYATGLTFALTILWILIGHATTSRELLLYLQIFGDTLLITLIVYSTGGLDSPFSFLYLISIITASMLLYRRGGMLIASASVILFGGLTDLMFYRVIPYPSTAWIFSGEAWSPAEIYLKLAVNFVGFYAAAVLTSYISEELRAASQALSARSEDLARLRALSENVIASISAGVMTLDLEGRVGFANYAATHILERDQSDVVGRFISELGMFSGRQWNEILREIDSSRLSKGEGIVELGDGRVKQVGFAVTPLVSAADTDEEYGVTLIFQDLSERRRLEQQLRFKDRMAAVGELSAGIAHEIRNPLAAISGSVQILERSENLQKSEQRLMSIIARESDRLNQSIADFLKFVKPGELEKEPFDIAADLLECVALLRNSSEVLTAHKIVTTIEPKSYEVTADANQIRQVFWNIARNAIQAMPEGGLLEIEAAPEGGRYQIVFRDHGTGMSEAQRQQMFDPFRTNRTQGTGIGMAISYRIVQEHGGSIQVFSEPGEGTEVRVSIPARKSSRARREEMQIEA